jgi:hypothetical protein
MNSDRKKNTQESGYIPARRSGVLKKFLGFDKKNHNQSHPERSRWLPMVGRQKTSIFLSS